MKKNIGSIDKSIRLIIAVVLVASYFAGLVTGSWGILALVVAAVMALTSLVNFCPLYGLFGINTARKTKAT